ncbi:MAG: winged helix-turn-helix domain-containing protein [Gemmatimonadota bacterium]
MVDSGVRVNGNRNAGQLRFGEFAFDPHTKELWRSGSPVALAPQPSLVLAALLRRAGRLVSREELREECWSAAAVSVDLALNTCIRQIRLALGEEAANPVFIQTVPRRGYRFAAPVSEVGSSVPEVQSLSPSRSRRDRYRWTGAAGAFALMTLALLALLSPNGDATVDVLPVQILGEVQGPALAGLLEDELRTVITKKAQAGVSVLAHQADSGIAGSDADADYVVQMSLHSPMQGERRLSVHIVRSADRAILWAGEFNPDCGEVDYPLQVIAHVVTGALLPRVT